MKKLFIIICCFFVMNACTKNSSGVFIRVQNNTSQNFKEIIANNKSFKNVNAAAITSYQHFESASGLPVAVLITNPNDTLYAGFIYNDWFGSLEDGKYTLKIFEDTSTISDFNCEYIKN